jgi:hypothetical protein
MRYYLLLLVVIATPARLYAQEREYSEVPIMAAAVKYMQRFLTEGIGRSQPIPPEYRRTDFRIDGATYLIEPIRTRVIDGRELGIQRTPTKSPTQDAVLVAQLSAAVSLDTTSVERAAKECRPYTARGAYGLTETYRACRFSQFEGVLGVSLPVISGDTARVEVWVWVNYPQQHAPESILDEVWEITLVRKAGEWRAVSHKYANAWRA